MLPPPRPTPTIKLVTPPAHTPTAAHGADQTLERILDAALELAEQFGIRRTTLEDVARTAGVDRVTIYRRIGSKDDLVTALSTREAGRAFAHIVSVFNTGSTIEERIVGGFAEMVRYMRAHTLFNRLMTADSATLLPRMTTGAGDILSAAIATMVGLLDQAVEDGLIDPADDFAARAEVVVRLVHSLVLTPTAVLDFAADKAVRTFAATYIVPLVVPARTA